MKEGVSGMNLALAFYGFALLVIVAACAFVAWRYDIFGDRNL